jgi:hypothetical protein
VKRSRCSRRVVNEEVGQSQCPSTRIRFRSAGAQSSAYFHKGLAYLEGALQKIQPLALEAGYLPPSESHVSAQEDDRAGPLGMMLRQILKLASGQEAHLVALNSGELDPKAR